MMYETIGNDRNRVSISGSKIKAIKFADDRAIVAVSAKALQKMVNKLNCTANYNMKKNHRFIDISVDGYKIEQVNYKSYLGQTITGYARCKTEIMKIIGMAKIAFYKKNKKNRYYY